MQKYREKTVWHENIFATLYRCNNLKVKSRMQSLKIYFDNDQITKRNEISDRYIVNESFLSSAISSSNGAIKRKKSAFENRLEDYVKVDDHLEEEKKLLRTCSSFSLFL